MLSKVRNLLFYSLWVFVFCWFKIDICNRKKFVDSHSLKNEDTYCSVTQKGMFSEKMAMINIKNSSKGLSIDGTCLGFKK